MKTSRSEQQQESFAALGLALTLLHEIESYFARAALLGLTERQRKKHRTVNDMWAARDRMTFGQLVALFKEDWALKPQFETLLDRFVVERNAIVHRITTLDGFSVKNQRDRLRLNARLGRFIELAFLMRKVFHGAYLVSNEFARDLLKSRGVDIPLKTPAKWREDVEYFLEVAEYKHGAQQSAPGDSRKAARA